MRTIAVTALAVVLAALHGCSWAPSLGVYKLEINQGNYVTEDMVERLKVGMTRSQVKTALGTPLLVDPFHANRWDYVFELRRNGRVVDHREFRVFFDGERLARWEGGALAKSPAAELRAAAEARAASGQAPPLAGDEGKGWFERIREKLGW